MRSALRGAPLLLRRACVLRRVGRRALGAAALIIALGATQPGWGHDLWIEPSSFAPEVGELVKVALRVGHPAQSEGLPRVRSLIERFDVVGRDTQELQGLEGYDPAGIYRPDDAAGVALVYVSAPADLELPAARFEEYLREEGLDSVLASRARAGGALEPGRERFSRSVKCLLASGGVDPTDRPHGLPLELVLRSPALAGLARIDLLFEGEPLPGALLELLRLDDGALVASARTDAEGGVGLALPPGRWLVTAVHATADTSGLADWRSWWSSLTFEAR